MVSKGVLFRLYRGKRKSAASSHGVFHLELPDELSWTTDSNGHAIKMSVMNLLCCERKEAEERAEEIIRSREQEHELLLNKNNQENLHMNNTLLEYVDKNGAIGDPLKVWDAYLSHICGGLVKVKGASKASLDMLAPNVRTAAYRRHGVLEHFAEWYKKPLTQVGADDVAAYISEMEKDEQFDAESFKKNIIDVLAEIWRVALPMSENHWEAVKYDLKRNAIVAPSSILPDANTLLRMPLLEFVELYFKNEAASGRKWEDNTRGFVTHLMEHTGVRNVGDVTRTVALDYAIALHNDGDAQTARSGRDRISKFHTIWNIMLPEVPNPWKNVSYESAMMANQYNEAVKKHETVDDVSKRFHNTDPHALFAEYATLHKFKPHRFGTVRSIFMRMWDKTGIKSPSDLTRETAFAYVDEIRRNKRSWDQDRSEIATMWYVCFPGFPNYWQETVERTRMTQIRKGEISFSQTHSDSAKESARRRREAGEFDHPAAPIVDGDPGSEPPLSNADKKINVKKAIEDLVDTNDKTGFLDKPFEKKVAAPAVVTAPHCFKVPRGRTPIATKLENGIPLTFTEAYWNWKKQNKDLKKETHISYRNRWTEIEKYCALHDIHQVSKTTIDTDFVRRFTNDVMCNIAKSTKLTFLSIAKNIWEASFPTGENPWKTMYVQVNSEPEPVLKSEQTELFVEEPKATEAKPKEAEAVEVSVVAPVKHPKNVVGEPKPVVPVNTPELIKSWGAYETKRKKSWVKRLLEKIFNWF